MTSSVVGCGLGEALSLEGVAFIIVLKLHVSSSVAREQ